MIIDWKLVFGFLASRIIGNTPKASLVCCRMLYIVFLTSDGQSPLYETKSSDEGQIIEAFSGQSPLYLTKSSDEGQFMMTQCGRSPL